MDQYKVVLQRRMKYVRWYLEALTACYISGAVFVRKQLFATQMEFLSGVSLSVAILLILYLYRTGKAIKEDETLKVMYIQEHDERNKFIKMQMGKVGIYLVLAGLSCATLLAGFFNQVVFLTLLGATLFTAIIMGILKLYYRRAC